MNWQKQMEEMVSAWTETQRRFWESWSDAAEGTGLPFPGEAMEQQYRRSLEAWEGSVREALQRQSEWAHTWSGNVLAEAPARDAAERWVTQVQEMMQGWTEAQSRLWSIWFENVRAADTDAFGAQWEQQARDIMEAWQEASTNAQETLAQWSRTVAEKSAGAGAAAQAAPAKKEAAPGPATERPPRASTSKAGAKAAPKAGGATSRSTKSTKSGGTGRRRSTGSAAGSKKGS